MFVKENSVNMNKISPTNKTKYTRVYMVAC